MRVKPFMAGVALAADAGVNVKYGDTARFSGITIINDSSRSMVICRPYEGNADGTNCFYSSSDLTYR